MVGWAKWGTVDQAFTGACVRASQDRAAQPASGAHARVFLFPAEPPATHRPLPVIHRPFTMCAGFKVTKREMTATSFYFSRALLCKRVK